MNEEDIKQELKYIEGLSKYIKRAKEKGNPQKVATLCKEKLERIQKIKQLS